MPVHGVAELEPAVPQQVEASPADLLGGRHDPVTALRDPPDQPGRGVGADGALKEPLGEALADPRRPQRCAVQRGHRGFRGGHPVQPFGRLLASAHGDLVDRHLQHALHPHADGSRAPCSPPAD